MLFWILIVTLIIYWKINYSLNYFKRQKLPYVSGIPIFGNMLKASLLKQCTWEVFYDIYNCKEAENQSIVGFFLFHQPAILLKDINLIKKVLISDFNSFVDHYGSADGDPVGSNSLLLLKSKIWKTVRSKLTPFFSTGNLKHLFNTLNQCGDKLSKHLYNIDKEKEIEIKNLCLRYANDQVANSIFSLQSNSIENEISEYFDHGKYVFKFNLIRALEFTSVFFLPKIANFFKFKFLSKEANDFMNKTIPYIIDLREKSKEKRNDIIDLYINIRNQKVYFNNKDEIILNDKIIIGTALSFFTAGYDTSASVMAFALYEIAKNEHVQVRLRNDIKQFLFEKNGEFHYDDLKELPYLEMVIKETLRKYPPLPFLDRKCTNINGYKLEEYNYKIPHGMIIIIPTFAIHYDPNIFKDPHTFDPERFSPENISLINRCTFLPFGEGNRQCIAKRFAILQIQIGLIKLLQIHRIKLGKNQSTNLKFEPKSLMFQVTGGLHLRLEKDILYQK